MNATSASPADTAETRLATTPAQAQAAVRMLVWDAPVRVFHWLLALSFAGAYITAESESWRLLHVTLGYTLAGLVVFRVLWGLIGTRYARFSTFVRGPRAVAGYLRAMVRGRPEHHVGHNPAGALAIVALLGLAALIAATGWATYNDVGGGWLEDLHELAANTMLAVVGLHIAGVVVASWLHRENLVRAMVTGYKTGSPQDGIARAWRSVAALMLVAVLGFWWLQWQGAPSTSLTDRPAAAAKAGHDGDDD
ncbi:cytochrome b/b6 domain-containing protein [Polaromonas sp. A23]|uniref:cytochrome b/b6 domain-containing protein n=1 Tax=Polaromonas sp. A23 TaxID=1944133 RepID=UPI00098749E4|nr:cytochrome b/b6 domain-containing protein [Polaromonas sp. A23]OOG39914.1 cytochrome B [Polaromonas sp. A23]